MHSINVMFLNLEGFKYDISLGLNMLYVHIPIIENTSNVCTITVTWGKCL